MEGAWSVAGVGKSPWWLPLWWERIDQGLMKGTIMVSMLVYWREAAMLELEPTLLGVMCHWGRWRW